MFGGSDKGAPVRKFRSTLAINGEFHSETAQCHLSTQFSVATMASDPLALWAPQLSHLPPRGADKPPPVVLCPAWPLENLLVFFSPFFSLLCAVGSHRLLLSIFQLVAADLYLNPNICSIQCELPIQPHAWLCLCSFEQTEWATWLCNADITWSLVGLVGADHMQEGAQGLGLAVPSSADLMKDEEDLPQLMCTLPNALQNGPTLY